MVEAKREHSIPAKGMQQAKRYGQLLDLPLAYATNGKRIVEDDRDTGLETEHLDAFPGPAAAWSRYRAWKGLADGVMGETRTASTRLRPGLLRPDHRGRVPPR